MLKLLQCTVKVDATAGQAAVTIVVVAAAVDAYASAATVEPLLMLHDADRMRMQIDDHRFSFHHSFLASFLHGPCHIALLLNLLQQT